VKGFHWHAIALICLCTVVATATASAQVRNAPHTVTAKGDIFLLDGQPSFLIIGQSHQCPVLQDDKGSSIIADMASIDVRIVQGHAGSCGPDSTTLDQALSSRNMLWWEQASSSLPESVDWQAPTHYEWAVFRCDTKSSLASYTKMATASKASPLLAYIQLGTRDPNAPDSCTTPLAIRNAFMVALVAHAKGISWVTINPKNATVGNGFSVSNQNAKAAASLTAMASGIAPSILNGSDLSVQALPGNVRAAAWKYNGKTTVIAVNTSATPAKATVIIPSLGKVRGKLSLSLGSMGSAIIRK
jgi:hypothetical protein